MQLETFCMKCRKRVEPVDGRIEVVQNPKGKRYAVRGTCPECGTKQYKFSSRMNYEDWRREHA